MENAEGKGILVKELTNGSPAAEAGLRSAILLLRLTMNPPWARTILI